MIDTAEIKAALDAGTQVPLYSGCFCDPPGHEQGCLNEKIGTTLKLPSSEQRTINDNARELLTGYERAELLEAALIASDAHMRRGQKLIAMFLEPGDRRIQSQEDLVDALITHFDGPIQRGVQSATRSALGEEQS